VQRFGPEQNCQVHTTVCDYNMRALCTDTSVILIAKDIHLNSDQGQSRHGLAPRATDTTIYCLRLATIGPVAAARVNNEHLETLRQFNIPHWPAYKC